MPSVEASAKKEKLQNEPEIAWLDDQPFWLRNNVGQ